MSSCSDPKHDISEQKLVPCGNGQFRVLQTPPNLPRAPQGARLPIVYVPVHIVMGMPMTVGMGMRMAITSGTKKHLGIPLGIARGYNHGHVYYNLAVPITLSIGTPEIHNIKGNSPLHDRGLSVTLTSHWPSRSHLALSSSLLCHCLLLPAAPGPRPPIPTFPESTFHLPS